MGLFSREKPKIKVQTSKKDGFSGWFKCSGCQELVHVNELQQNLNCCPKCDYHYRLSVQERVDLVADKGSFIPLFDNLVPSDPLSFVDSVPYLQRIQSADAKAKTNEAVVTGSCTIGAKPLLLGVFNFDYMAGSMGSCVGEKLTLLIEKGIEEKIPLVIFSCSGGARMQESILSLMQMAKTSAALAKLAESSVPYISVLTNPTTGGVTASFASLGDVILAEPKALICFAGPRVIEQTIGQKLPPGFQRSEFLLEHGMIDAIVQRKAMKEKLAQILGVLDV